MTRSLSANFTCWRPDEPVPPPEEIRRLTQIMNAFVSELLSREPWWFVHDVNTSVKSYRSDR